MKSKNLVVKHLQPVLDTGMTQAEVARALGIDSPNYVSMLKNPDSPKSLLSPNRIPQFAKLCEMPPQEVISFMFARLDDATDNKIELTKDTFKFLLVNFAACVDEFRARSATR